MEDENEIRRKLRAIRDMEGPELLRIGIRGWNMGEPMPAGITDRVQLIRLAREVLSETPSSEKWHGH